MIVLFYLLLFTFVLADESLLPPSSLQPMLYNMKGKWVDVGNEFPGSRPQQPASENWKVGVKFDLYVALLSLILSIGSKYTYICFDYTL